MAHFTVYAQAGAALSADEAERSLNALPDTAIIDRAGRLFLIDTPEENLDAVRAAVPGWNVVPETKFGIPDPRPRILRPPQP